MKAALESPGSVPKGNNNNNNNKDQSSTTIVYPKKDEPLTMRSLEAAVGKAAFQHGTGEQEESSSSSGGHSGNGSGGGYSADCSSSDASSDTPMNVGGTQQPIDTPSTTKANDSKEENKKPGLDSNHDSNRSRTSTATNSGNIHNIQQNSGPIASSIANSHSVEKGHLPQLNGIRIHNPMDPRIDISMLQHIQLSSVAGTQLPGHDTAAVEKAGNDSLANQSSANIQVPTSMLGNEMGAQVFPSSDHYLHLLEAVRPFFLSAPSTQKLNGGSGSDGTQALSSEGFTSFFTTTNSNSTGSETDARLPQNGDRNHISEPGSAIVAAAAAATAATTTNATISASNLEHRQEKAYPPVDSPAVAAAAAAAVAKGTGQDSDPDSDSVSSMVVLARVKRKHLKKHAGYDASKNSSSNSNTSSERKVRINENGPRESGLHDQPPNEDASSHLAAHHEAPTGVAAADPSLPVAVAAAAEPAVAARESSSSSEDQANGQEQINVQQQNIAQGEPAVGFHHYPPRVISESSERNGSSTSRTMTTTSGSGTGSGSGSGTGSGNGSGSGSGAGSNNGSSGSGNEGKGSGSDQVKGENSGEEVHSNSDECNNRLRTEVTRNEQVRAASLQSSQNDVNSVYRNVPSQLSTSPATSNIVVAKSCSRGHGSKTNEIEAREKKLLDKKRKRMNMRREYEEHVKEQLASSESSSGDEFLRPGKPITLDDVLGFTKTARLVVQSRLPFLVVHANAAFTTLSGIDSHAAVGKPVSSLMSIPQPTSRRVDTVGGEAAAGEGVSSVSGSSTQTSRHQQQNLPAANLHEASAENQEALHAAAAAAGRARAASTHVDDMCLERLIAASGYGCFHTVNVTAKPEMYVTFINEQPSLPKIAKGGGNVNSSNPNNSNRDEQGSHTSTIPSADGGRLHVACRMGVSPVVSTPHAMDSAVVTDSGAHRHHHNHHHHHHSNSGTLTHNSSSGKKETATTYSSNSKRRGNSKHHCNGGDHLSSQRSYHIHHFSTQKESIRLTFNTHRNAITHYAIELEPINGSSPRQQRRGSGEGGNGSASTTTTLEAQIYGITKAELKRRRLTSNEGDAAAGGVAARQEQGIHQDSNDDDELIDMDSQESPPVTACG